MNKKFMAQSLACFLAGIFYALGFPSFLAETLIITPIIGFAVFFLLIDEASLKGKILLLLSFSAGFNFFGFYWVSATIKEFGMLPWPIAILLGILFTAIILPQLWIYIFIDWKLSGMQFYKKLKSSQKIVIGAFIYALLERYTPQQFPAHIGHSWFGIKPMLGMASIFGVSFYSFLSLLLAFQLKDLIKQRKLSLSVVLTIIIMLGVSPIQIHKKIDTKQLNLRVVQANIGNFMKVAAEKGGISSMSEVFDRYASLSTNPYPHGSPDLIIWPETAFPYAFMSELLDNGKAILPPLFTSIVRKMNSELVTGGYDRKANAQPGSYFETEFNTVFHVGKDAKLKSAYHKHMLIPFGETLPFPTFLNVQLEKLIPGVSFFARGDKFNGSELESGLRYISPVCYEILYSRFIRTFLNEFKNSHMIINLTNDSWFGNTSEPYQHLFLSKWRSVEFLKTIIRSTNTGITSIIYPSGLESKRLKIGEQNSLDLRLDIDNYEITLFQKFGELLFLGLSIFVFFLATILRKEILL